MWSTTAAAPSRTMGAARPAYRTSSPSMRAPATSTAPRSASHAAASGKPRRKSAASETLCRRRHISLAPTRSRTRRRFAHATTRMTPSCGTPRRWPAAPAKPSCSPPRRRPARTSALTRASSAKPPPGRRAGVAPARRRRPAPTRSRPPALCAAATVSSTAWAPSGGQKSWLCARCRQSSCRAPFWRSMEALATVTAKTCGSRCRASRPSTSGATRHGLRKTTAVPPPPEETVA
mmetsp:Transcript_35380/g.70327  ORF Transcript_35380/g.70327 Transcript_35380/m.70327 type:complete len:234 (+) Transcript_35380:224-925(+)